MSYASAAGPGSEATSSAVFFSLPSHYSSPARGLPSTRRGPARGTASCADVVDGRRRGRARRPSKERKKRESKGYEITTESADIDG